jgi:hypothetical protein
LGVGAAPPDTRRPALPLTPPPKHGRPAARETRGGRAAGAARVRLERVNVLRRIELLRVQRKERPVPAPALDGGSTAAVRYRSRCAPVTL